MLFKNVSSDFSFKGHDGVALSNFGCERIPNVCDVKHERYVKLFVRGCGKQRELSTSRRL
jgi:hypothetical protein